VDTNKCTQRVQTSAKKLLPSILAVDIRIIYKFNGDLLVQRYI